jgi:hypothetical protein
MGVTIELLLGDPQYLCDSKPDDGAYRDVHQVLLLPSRPDTVFMTIGVGFYRSSDGGDHWERPTDEEFRLAYPDYTALCRTPSSTSTSTRRPVRMPNTPMNR